MKYLKSSVFQSYLYGIEMIINYYGRVVIVQFQSYLYGIEMYFLNGDNKSDSKFQSYLYGIEIVE